MTPSVHVGPALSGLHICSKSSSRVSRPSLHFKEKMQVGKEAVNDGEVVDVCVVVCGVLNKEAQTSKQDRPVLA